MRLMLQVRRTERGAEGRKKWREGSEGTKTPVIITNSELSITS